MSEDSSKLTRLPEALRQQSGWWVAPVALMATVVIFFSSQIIGGLVIDIIPILRHYSGQQTSDWLANSVGAQFAFGLLADGLVVLGVALMLKFLHWSWAD